MADLRQSTSFTMTTSAKWNNIQLMGFVIAFMVMIMLCWITAIRTRESINGRDNSFFNCTFNGCFGIVFFAIGIPIFLLYTFAGIGLSICLTSSPVFVRMLPSLITYPPPCSFIMFLRSFSYGFATFFCLGVLFVIGSSIANNFLAGAAFFRYDCLRHDQFPKNWLCSSRHRADPCAAFCIIPQQVGGVK